MDDIRDHIWRTYVALHHKVGRISAVQLCQTFIGLKSLDDVHTVVRRLCAIERLHDTKALHRLHTAVASHIYTCGANGATRALWTSLFNWCRGELASMFSPQLTAPRHEDVGVRRLIYALHINDTASMAFLRANVTILGDVKAECSIMDARALLDLMYACQQ